MSGIDPKPGDALIVGRQANGGQAGEGQVSLRVIKVLPTQARLGWIWLYGYEITRNGRAKRRRAVLALRNGLEPVEINAHPPRAGPPFCGGVGDRAED
jgi:hypothetical protein